MPGENEEPTLGRVTIDEVTSADDLPSLVERLHSVASQPALEVRIVGEAPLHASAIVTLSSWIAAKRADGIEVVLVPNGRRDTAMDATDRGLLRALEWPEFLTDWGANASGVPNTPIRDARAVRELANQLEDLLLEELGDEATSATRFARFVLEELAHNIVAHSERSDTGFGNARVDKEADRLEIAFADAGIGIRESLTRSWEYAGRIQDDAHALRLAVEQGISSKGDSRRHSGIGLSQVKTMADALDGTAWIYSGRASLRREGRETRIFDAPKWQGTVVAITVPLGLD